VVTPDPVGRWLGRRRHQLGLTRTELAAKAGCSAATVKKIEAGSRRPSPVLAVRLAVALDLSPAEQATFLHLVDTAAGRDPAPPPVVHPPLVGRADDSAALRALLLDPVVRLVTLTGPPGVGASSLAAHAATAVAGAFADGSAVVALRHLDDPALLPSAVCAALGLDDGGDAGAALRTALATAELLLVLDDPPATAGLRPVLAGLLDAVGGLTLLVTGTGPLHLPAERVFRVPPLAVPGPETGTDVSEVPAVRLLVGRVRAYDPTFELTAATVAAVVGLCRRLDGLPLALDLVAPTVAVLGPAEVLDRLGQPDGTELGLLGTPAADDPAAGGRSVEASVARRYALLGPDRQRVLRALSTFDGAGTLPAVEAVCAGADAVVSDALVALVGHGLVTRVAPVDAPPRYTLLSCVRSCARAWARDSGEEETLARRHAAYWLTRAEAPVTGRWAGAQGVWLRELAAEQPNLRAALSWALAAGEVATAARLAGALGRFWLTRGDPAEGRTWLDAVLAGRDRLPGRLRAGVLLAAGMLACRQGDLSAAADLAGEAVTLLRGQDDPSTLTAALTVVGTARMLHGGAEPARTAFTEVLALAEATGDHRAAASALCSLGWIALVADDDEARAEELIARSLTCYQRMPAARVVGPASVAVDAREAAMAAASDHDSRYSLYAALDKLRAVGDRVLTGRTLYGLGVIALHERDPARSRRLFTEGLTLLREAGVQDGVATAVEGLAELALYEGHDERAAELYGAASRLREDTGASPSVWSQDWAERSATVLAGRMGADGFASAWERGRAMDPDDAVAAALRPPAAARSTDPATADGGPALTGRERAVLALAAQGLTSAGIARRLLVSPHTVSAHLHTIYRKLGVPSRSAAVTLAVRRGLV
jgi:predicted ATPase/DNA-binding CsgD family transcriptional regulator/transcriptional regulator with XRE-family HTH domain